ncbi:ImmA/IrrE family metallo-endopeptidase [Sediminibacterium sp.]|uniref:ImmA/IrrE family metallo-endopeptidase n=1 Tax=Sediminibacterium sp. TaxID=1917865 RepID=UPI002731E20E|nr:ImmA/IrrE family metallo-endopeptidase [Sediminibacterium sp.]MDP1973213.1 ImmA/IrrE family metallo-endopeptidase [Sediminibacterium sp.]MDP2420096.1 ImmA/IrrE family metallo-endopeptidase [Sediminibacterium sp.]
MIFNNIIEERAEKLLKDSNCFSIPVKLLDCASYLNIDIKEMDIEDSISGFVAINGKNVQIGVNKNHSSQRQRFTIAHEIGHFALHSQSEQLFVDKNDNNAATYLFRDEKSASGEYIKEREANSFAAALLMPKKMINEEIVKIEKSLSLSKITELLAHKFEVSTQAMSIRLSRLGYFDYDNAYE